MIRGLLSLRETQESASYYTFLFSVMLFLKRIKESVAEAIPFFILDCIARDKKEEIQYQRHGSYDRIGQEIHTIKGRMNNKH